MATGERVDTHTLRVRQERAARVSHRATGTRSMNIGSDFSAPSTSVITDWRLEPKPEPNPIAADSGS